MKGTVSNHMAHVLEAEPLVYWRAGSNSVTNQRYLLVDKSDITNFPHNETNRLDLSQLQIQMGAVGTVSGQWICGRIASVSGGSSNTVELAYFNFSNASIVGTTFNWRPSQAQGSSENYLGGGDALESSGTAYINGSTYTTPTVGGTAQPGVGDVFLKLINLSGTVDWWTARAWYHSH